MASVVRSGRGWRARVRRGGVDLGRTFRTRRDAERWAAQVEADIESVGVGSSRPFGDALERWRDEVAPGRDGYVFESRRIGALLGDPTRAAPDRAPDPLVRVPMRELGPDDFADWRDRRLGIVSAATVLREWNLLSSVCTRAWREWRWLTSNPMAGVARPKAPCPRQRRVSDDEVERVLLAAGYAPDGLLDSVRLRVCAAFLFALETALRAGELCALRVGDFDLDARVLVVRAEDAGARKTGHGRDVPLTRRAVEIARQLGAGTRAEGERLFLLNRRQLDANWRKLRQMAGIDGLHFHDTRAEALTRLSRKLDVMQLARVSGHRDLRQLLNTYYRASAAEFVGLLDD